MADMDRVEEGAKGGKSAGVRTPGAAGDERWGVLAASTGRRGVHRSRGRVRGVGDDVVGKVVQGGRASPAIVLPKVAALRGLRFHLAAVVIDPRRRPAWPRSPSGSG